MFRSIMIRMTLLIGILTFTLSTFAQDSGTITRIGYYIAQDTNGIRQVFQLVLSEDQSVRQLTHATSDVINFGVAYDGLSIAYINDGQLFLQPIHTEEPEALATITATEHLQNPVFDPDGNYVAYTDNGIWLLDLATRETHQLLENVPFTKDSESVGELRIYSPEKFFRDASGNVTRLIVDIGMWEWGTAGVVDLTTGDLQMIEDVTYTDLLPLYGNRMLIYGNNAMNGGPVIRLATDDNINAYSEVFNFSGVIDDVITLFASQAIEIAPGTVRVLGTVLSNEPEPNGFYFDYDLMANELRSVNTIAMPPSESSAVEIGKVSTDGALIPMYTNVAWTETGTIFGQLSIFDLITGDKIYTLSDAVSQFQWQP